jgi:hypothetical protein
MKALVGALSVSLVLAAAASAQTPAGGEFRVNTYTTGAQLYGRPAMESDGDFVVVWISGQGGSSYEIIGQRFAASGVPRGSEFQVNTYTEGFENQPAVAAGSRGDFVVAWRSIQDGSNTSIQGRRYDASGGALGAEFLVNTFTADSQVRPRVGRASDGRFVVSWTSYGGDGSGYGIAARRFDASGSPIGSEFVVNTYTPYDQKLGDVAVEANGSFVVVWQDFNDHDGSDTGIFGQRYDASGNTLGSEFQVNSYTTGFQFYPSVSVSPAGGFVVVWSSTDADGSVYGVVSRRFDASGNPIGGDFLVNTYTTSGQYGRFGQIAHDARGNFVVTWGSRDQDGSAIGIFAQRFSASGAPRGAEFPVNAYTTGFQRQPSVASDAVGNFVVVWGSPGEDGSDYGVFAQRFGGLGPAGLTVDGSGNQVLEPGETAVVRPTWRNFNGAAQTFSGILANFTGPIGGTYNLVDGVGDYGTVANDTSAPCTDCYAVTISPPSTRPVMHWDASAVESISPDTQGQQKQWVLHVAGSFTDVLAASPFYRFVETLFHRGVTGGCGGTNYCPSATTTRDQMSVFVLVAKEGAGYMPPACGTPMFNDVPASNPFCRYIEELARRGVVSGCGGGAYCPTSAVTREQMAIFVLRTLDPALNPPACVAPNMFADVPETSPFCRWIEELATRGVVTGCGGSNYCPTASVTREQMGVFISATFGLTLYGP